MLRTVDVYVAPNTGGESFGDRPARGDGRRGPRCWPATSRRSAGCSTAAGPGGCSGSGDAPTWPSRRSGCSPTRPSAPTLARGGGAAWSARYDWADVAERILAVYETVTWSRAEGARGLARAGVRPLHPAQGRACDRRGGWSRSASPSLLGLYLRGLAGRLDRLHVRVDAARDALDAQLVRRTAAALELAHAGLLDPATSVLLAEEAYGAQTADATERARSESELTGALHAALPDAADGRSCSRDSARGAELLDALRAACGAGRAGPPVLQRRGARHPGAAQPAAGALAATGRDGALPAHRSRSTTCRRLRSARRRDDVRRLTGSG